MLDHVFKSWMLQFKISRELWMLCGPGGMGLLELMIKLKVLNSFGMTKFRITDE